MVSLRKLSICASSIMVVLQVCSMENWRINAAWREAAELECQSKMQLEYQKLQQYIKEGGDVNEYNSIYQLKPLSFAVKMNDVPMVQILLQKRALLTIQDSEGNSPLHVAVENGNADIVRLLINAQAQVDVQTDMVGLPLYVAAARNNMAIVGMLLEARAKSQPNIVNIRDAERNSPLHAAVENGNADIVRLLISAGAHKDLQNRYGLTPLHLAVKNGSADIVLLLINAQAQVNLQDKYGRTPLHLAAEQGRDNVMAALLRLRHAATNLEDGEGRTPLHLAAENGRTTAAAMLLKVGAQVNKKTRSIVLHYFLPQQQVIQLSLSNA